MGAPHLHVPLNVQMPAKQSHPMRRGSDMVSFPRLLHPGSTGTEWVQSVNKGRNPTLPHGNRSKGRPQGKDVILMTCDCHILILRKSSLLLNVNNVPS
jgi:hypothetical protein